MLSSEYHPFSSPGNASLITVKSEQDKTLSPGHISDIVDRLDGVDENDTEKDEDNKDDKDQPTEDQLMEDSESTNDDEIDDGTEKVEQLV